MRKLRMIKPYSLSVGTLVQTGTHFANDKVPLVEFINDETGEVENPGILYGRDHDNYFLETPENLRMLEILKRLDAKIEYLRDVQGIIVKSMTEPIYAESFFEHAMIVDIEQ